MASYMDTTEIKNYYAKLELYFGLKEIMINMCICHQDKLNDTEFVTDILDLSEYYKVPFETMNELYSCFSFDFENIFTVTCNRELFMKILSLYIYNKMEKNFSDDEKKFLLNSMKEFNEKYGV